MLFKTHFVFALLIFLLSYSNYQNRFLFGLFLLFSTLFVDIDSKKSKMGHILIFRPFQLFFSHRGITHSLFFAFFLASLIFILDSSAGWGFLLGYLLHLVLDCLCVSGIYLFKPFSNFKLCGFIKTGSILEDILFVFVLLLDFFLIFKIVLKILLSII
jgi:inner membrane protein